MTQMNRRQWIQTGVIGAMALGTAAALGPRLLSDLQGGGRWEPGSTQPSVWSPAAASLMGAVAPVILGSTFKASDSSRLMESIQALIDHLSPAAQQELRELFSLLAFSPVRGALTGVWGAWSAASRSDIESFLQRWRHSRLGLLVGGYQALYDIVLGAWYADPASWDNIGYPGPPQLP